MEIGALTVMTIGFRERELVLDLFELITGLRLNHAYIRPGGVANDLPADGIEKIRDFHTLMSKRVFDYIKLCNENPIFKGRLVDVGYLDLAGCMALGITGPVLRSTGLPWDLRKTQPYLGYEDFDFEVPTWDTCDAYGRFRIRLDEMVESLRIIEQVARPPRGDRPRAGDGRRPEDRLAGAAVHRRRRSGQQPGAHQQDHERVDGGPDPPLQARDRGLLRPGRTGLHRRRVAPR